MNIKNFRNRVFSVVCVVLIAFIDVFSINITFIGPNDNKKLELAYLLLHQSSSPSNHRYDFRSPEIIGSNKSGTSSIYPADYKFVDRDPLSRYLTSADVTLLVLSASDLADYSYCEEYITNQLIPEIKAEKLWDLPNNGPSYRTPSPVCLCITGIYNINAQALENLARLQNLCISDSNLCPRRFEEKIFFLTEFLGKFKFCKVGDFDTKDLKSVSNSMRQHIEGYKEQHKLFKYVNSECQPIKIGKNAGSDEVINNYEIPYSRQKTSQKITINFANSQYYPRQSNQNKLIEDKESRVSTNSDPLAGNLKQNQDVPGAHQANSIVKNKSSQTDQIATNLNQEQKTGCQAQPKPENEKTQKLEPTNQHTDASVLKTSSIEGYDMPVLADTNAINQDSDSTEEEDQPHALADIDNSQESNSSNSLFKKVGLGALVTAPFVLIATLLSKFYNKFKSSKKSQNTEVIHKHEII